MMRPTVRLAFVATAICALIVFILNSKLHLSPLHDQVKKLYERRENAVFVTLARNAELEKLVPSIKSYEANFNSQYHYDWVFLNNEEFTEEFKATVAELISGNVKFGIIGSDHWSLPDWVSRKDAEAAFKFQHENGVPYGESESYHHMCRFESGFFFDHPLLKPYRYYWRVEPETKLLCRHKYDVFRFLRENDIKYTWTISITEWPNTVVDLWETTLEWARINPDYVHPLNLAGFVSDDNMETYNMCHFWSNFEIADMNFYRSDAYRSFFNYLDRTGNFFLQRWGDAPVHSIAASLLLNKNEIHFFEDLGYSHPPFDHCPANQGLRGLECDCGNDDPLYYDNDSFDWHQSSCLRNYLQAKGVSYVEGNQNFIGKKTTSG